RRPPKADPEARGPETRPGEAQAQGIGERVTNRGIRDDTRDPGREDPGPGHFRVRGTASGGPGGPAVCHRGRVERQAGRVLTAAGQSDLLILCRRTMQERSSTGRLPRRRGACGRRVTRGTAGGPFPGLGHGRRTGPTENPPMRLGPGEFFGRPAWERGVGGLLLTLSVYRPGPAQPWHDHANP